MNTGGLIQINPNDGVALSTHFAIAAPQWTDDTSDYPFNYEFSYLLTSSAPEMVVWPRNIQSSVASVLPSGLQSNDYMLIIKVRVYDVWAASTQANITVRVKMAALASVGDYFSEQQSKALESGNVDAISQLVNIVATTVSNVNCSLATNSFCAQLNREICSSFPNTCGRCNEGYLFFIFLIFILTCGKQYFHFQYSFKIYICDTVMIWALFSTMGFGSPLKRL